MEKEIWKSLKGVVDNGDNYSVSSLGKIRNDKLDIVLKHAINKGYHCVGLCSKSKRINYTVHRLVALAFLDNPSDKEQVNHLDGNKSNNKLSNLEWSTRSENTKHAYDTGLSSRVGEKNSKNKLTSDDVIEIRRLFKTGKYNTLDLANRYNVTRPNINSIVKGKSWKHLL
ncbi:HNH endonuclease [Bacillus phage Kioshi]|nr:HNH endonuclease [Bacillus phage Kioshi]